ncbi:MAG: hypothetical protein E2O68_06025 [Deltaproteobacteria bacterium]|nr:MAG: hypothetical protein E2O68_06025 [Deltaproteobacteria bacterium]
MKKLLIITLCGLSFTTFAQRDFADQLGEKIEGCPEGCTCITDINRESKARKKLGESVDEDKTGVKDKRRRRRIKSK